MGRKDHNDELREERLEQAEQRQEQRDGAFEETGGTTADLGSQDQRRKEGDEHSARSPE